MKKGYNFSYLRTKYYVLRTFWLSYCKQYYK